MLLGMKHPWGIYILSRDWWQLFVTLLIHQVMDPWQWMPSLPVEKPLIWCSMRNEQVFAPLIHSLNVSWPGRPNSINNSGFILYLMRVWYLTCNIFFNSGFFIENKLKYICLNFFLHQNHQKILQKPSI
jgi:hypothetical protein